MSVNTLMDDWRAEEPQTLKGRESAPPLLWCDPETDGYQTQAGASEP